MNGKGRVTIRSACTDDVAAIDRMHRASIRKLCAPFYTREQLAHWLSAIKPRGYLAAMELYDFMVAVDGGIAGMCIFSSPKAEISALYVSPRAAGRGVGRLLLKEAEAIAREAGIRELSLKSTLNAAGFYEHLGFARVELTAFDLPGGTSLPCIAMTKRLPSVLPGD
jgi:GNAT superfamily N-acetyltransferase